MQTVEWKNQKEFTWHIQIHRKTITWESILLSIESYEMWNHAAFSLRQKHCTDEQKKKKKKKKKLNKLATDFALNDLQDSMKH